jgi:uncharacterized protein (TIGR00369 family)
MTDQKHENGRAFKGFPHVEWLEMRTHETESGVVLLSVPYRKQLIGDMETGVIHGGVVTTLLDSGCGMAAIMRTGLIGFIATLSLRIDYMRPAKPDYFLWARCECYRVTRSVAFTRGLAYDDDPNDPVATSAGSFMLTKPKFNPKKALE